jgi:hypothetical protein
MEVLKASSKEPRRGDNGLSPFGTAALEEVQLKLNSIAIQAMTSKKECQSTAGALVHPCRIYLSILLGRSAQDPIGHGL